jgi:uncharacterized repeat protein (TIGR03803 family)
MDKNGNLYGVTQTGGAFGWGVVYDLNRKGRLTVLHSFAGGTAGGTKDGCEPSGTPAMDTDGNLYGTTYLCGSSNEGIVWKLSNKRTETVLHNFVGFPKDGQYPIAGVVMDAAGNLYGTTSEGGTSGPGTVYELNKKHVLTLLHSFHGSDGENPLGGVTMDRNGNLYGTTVLGTVYELNKKRRLTVLHSFNGTDGAYPEAGVIIDAKGDLYGTASEGGTSGGGTVWEIAK